MIVVDALLNTLYPRYCLYCETLLDVKDEGICIGCFKELKLVDPAQSCPKCMHPSKGVCASCKHNHYPFNRIMITLEEDIMSRKLCYHLDKKLRKSLVALMVIQLNRVSTLDYDGVTYLSDYHLAKEISQALSIPLKQKGEQLLLVAPSIDNFARLCTKVNRLKQKGAKSIDVLLLTFS